MEGVRSRSGRGTSLCKDCTWLFVTVPVGSRDAGAVGVAAVSRSSHPSVVIISYYGPPDGSWLMFQAVPEINQGQGPAWLGQGSERPHPPTRTCFQNPLSSIR